MKCHIICDLKLLIIEGKGGVSKKVFLNLPKKQLLCIFQVLNKMTKNHNLVICMYLK